MSTIATMFEIAGGQQSDVEAHGPAQRGRLAGMTLLGAVVGAAVYGVSVGAAEPMMALANLLKVPMVVVFSVVAALPSGLLAWKICGSQLRATDLLMSVASGSFTGALVLVAAAPLVALYYLTGSAFGAPLAIGAAVVAGVAGFFVFLRAAYNRLPEGARRREALIPVVVIGGIQLLAMLQLIGLASPILPELTPFSGGLDGLF
ncbi:MAG: hypothetical protein ACQEVA_15260 [Myxococcota bacterium]